MIKDIHTLKGQNLTGDALNDEALQTFRSFGLRSSDQTLSLMDFLSGVGQLRFRGTSVLFRLTLPMTELLKRPSSIASNPMIVPSAASSHGTKSNRSVSTITMGRRSDIPHSPIKPPLTESSHPYEIATHIVKVSCDTVSESDGTRCSLSAGEKDGRRCGYHIVVRSGNHRCYQR